MQIGLSTIFEHRNSDRIAVVVPYSFMPPTNGGQRVCYNFCHALSKRYETVCISCHQGNHKTRFKLWPILRQSVLKYLEPRSIVNLIDVFRRFNIYTCVINHPFFFPVAFIACRITGRKLITYSHNLEYRRLNASKRYLRPFLFGLEFLAYRFSDGAFFISRSELTDAIRLFHLDKNRCFFVPHIVRKHALLTEFKRGNNAVFTIIFFGDFAYQPNLHGLRVLLTKIAPLLEDQLNFDYRLVIFGKNVPDSLRTTFIQDQLPVEFLGFVENPYQYIQTADVMINPVCGGAGVQTKIIEALSLGTVVLSAHSGSRGIELSACGKKLITVSDDDWSGYVTELIAIKNNNLHLSPTPSSFFDVYLEENVVKTVTSALESFAR